MTERGSETIRRFHGHLHDTWRLLARSVPGGWVEDQGGLRCIATGSASPYFNLALTNVDLPDPQTALDAAHDRYRSVGLRWLLKLQPELDREMVAHAGDRGIDLEEVPVYGLSIRPWASTRRSAAPLSIVVAGRESIEDAVRCFAEAFETDADEVWRELGPNLLTVPSFTVFVGYLAGEPVATSMLATTPSVRLAGIYSVATRPSARGRGFGTALTEAALNAARAQGFEAAVLEPSPMAETMYRRIGFEPITRYLEAVMGPTSTDTH